MNRALMMLILIPAMVISAENGTPYSERARAGFMVGCSLWSPEDVCECTLERVSARYTEDVFLMVDRDISNDTNAHPDFAVFVGEAAVECGYAEPPDEYTIRKNVEKYLSMSMKHISRKEWTDYYRKTLLNNSGISVQQFLGKDGAKRIASCVYDKVSADIPYYAGRIIEMNGDYHAFKDAVLQCIPDSPWTSNTKSTLIKVLNQSGVPNTVSKCFVNSIAMEYSFKSFMNVAIEHKENFAIWMMPLLERCLRYR